jgi:hypothetical protein
LKSYADQTSEALGVSRRTVARDLARGKNIDPEVRAEDAVNPQIVHLSLTHSVYLAMDKARGAESAKCR